LQITHGFPPATSIIAVLLCATAMGALYQYLFPRPARWPLVGIALVLGGALTVSLTYLLSPTKDRLAEIHDLWSALRVVVFTVGLPEEAVKFTATVIALVAFGSGIARPRGVTAAEAFQASLFSALGFAIVENMLYAKAFAEASLVIAIGRGIIASFIHGLMAMIQGFFLARFVATGYRRWHLPVIGYLCAAAAHAGFDWGMLKPLAEYLQNKGHVQNESIVSAIPILIVGLPAPFIAGLWCLRRTLRAVDDTETYLSELDLQTYRRSLRRWHRTGTAFMIVGGIGIAIIIVAAVVLAVTGAIPQPSADATPSGLSSPELRNSLFATGAIALCPVLVLLGWLLRQKR
jgi:RsiW-degrading membrane proteinase PrsW (M82 family)